VPVATLVSQRKWSGRRLIQIPGPSFEFAAIVLAV
jgi:hypothetical protein